MFFSRQWHKVKFTQFLFLIFTVLLLVALVIGCAPAAPSGKTTPSASPIVIGCAASLNTTAKDISLAAQMAADEINTSGGVTIDGVNRQLKIVPVDDRDLEASVPVADSLLAISDVISNNKPNGMIYGMIRTEVQLAVQQNMAKEKIPQIFTGSLNSSWQNTFKKDPATYKYQFRISPTDVSTVVLLMGAMDFIKQKTGYNTATIFAEDVDYGRAAATAVKPMLEKAGWTVKDEVFVPLGTTDYSAPMTKFKNSGAQVGFLIMSVEGAQIPGQCQAMGIKSMFIGACSPLFEEETYKLTNGAIEGFCLTSTGLGVIPEPKFTAAQTFYDGFVKKYGYSPRICLGVDQTYDAVYMLANTWKKNGSLDPDKTVAGIESTPYSGVNGLATFTAANHQCPLGTDPTKTFGDSVFQWQNGKRVVVYPLNLAVSDIQIPQ